MSDVGAVPRGEREERERCEVRERGRSTRHVNKAGRAGNQAEGPDWLKPLHQVDATSACASWWRGSTLSRRVGRGRAAPMSSFTRHVVHVIT